MSVALPVVTMWPASRGRALGAEAVGEPDQDVPRVAEDVAAEPFGRRLAVAADGDGLGGKVVVAPAFGRRAEAERAADRVVGDQVRRCHREPVGVARIRRLDRRVDAGDRRPQFLAGNRARRGGAARGP